MTRMQYLDKQKKAVLLRAAELSETEVEDGATNNEIVAALRANDVDDEHFTFFLLPQINLENGEDDDANDGDDTDAPKAKPDGDFVERKVAQPGISPAEEGGTPWTPPARNVITSASLEGKAEEVDEEVGGELDESADEHLVKYLGNSPSYERKGYRFSRNAPFVVVKTEDVEKILANEQFRLASPGELEEFYS